MAKTVVDAGTIAKPPEPITMAKPVAKPRLVTIDLDTLSDDERQLVVQIKEARKQGLEERAKAAKAECELVCQRYRVKLSEMYCDGKTWSREKKKKNIQPEQQAEAA